ncbi:MAG TPA: hypothetical protein PL155_04895 [Candidatus Omnitrophota bacterium]|nr:hypothetical protein [Candidatus Omnitrophota bacterium]HPD84184.1 hypothetical protein [Candidatus Omnitrophota bacterium]HRZ03040.1 hypothetical protein [Candidatus Omnitrophota bacterium]
MRKVFLAGIFLLVGATLVCAKAKDIKFCLTYTQEEAKAAKAQKGSLVARPGEKSKDVFVAPEPFLSNKDIQSIVITKKEETADKDYPRIEIIFTEEGARVLKEVTEKNLRKTVAVIVGKEVLMTPYVVFPLAKGRMFLTTWKIATDEAAEKFASDLGFTPTFQSPEPKP